MRTNLPVWLFIALGLYFWKRENSVRVYAWVQLYKRLIDKFLQWPFNYKVKVTFVDPIFHKHQELLSCTPFAPEYLDRPPESSNLSFFCYLSRFSWRTLEVRITCSFYCTWSLSSCLQKSDKIFLQFSWLGYIGSSKECKWKSRESNVEGHYYFREYKDPTNKLFCDNSVIYTFKYDSIQLVINKTTAKFLRFILLMYFITIVIFVLPRWGKK